MSAVKSDSEFLYLTAAKFRQSNVAPARLLITSGLICSTNISVCSKVSGVLAGRKIR